VLETEGLAVLWGGLALLLLLLPVLPSIGSWVPPWYAACGCWGDDPHPAVQPTAAVQCTAAALLQLRLHLLIERLAGIG
jgi:hypothetical protein